MRLRGKVALVTGSTRGVGAEIAAVYAQQGAFVVVTGRNAERGKAVVEDILASGGKAIFVESEPGSEPSVRNLVDRTVAAYGRIDILVDNVAAGETASCGKHVIPRMAAAGGGSVINISFSPATRSTRGPRGVRVNTIVIGPAPRPGETADVAELAVHLGSDDSTPVTAGEFTAGEFTAGEFTAGEAAGT